MRRSLQHPARLVPLAFVVAIAIGTVLLMLPLSRPGAQIATPLAALFTATGATCGALANVDTSTYWSGFGQLIVALLMQVGGLGIMTLATLLGLAVSRRFGLRTRIIAQSETQTLTAGDVRSVLTSVAITTGIIEAITAIVLALRFAQSYGYGTGKAIWYGIFHSISAFNNAGYALYSDNLMGFANDAWICVPIALAAIVGGLGFPVVFELVRHRRKPSGWTIHTKLTLLGTAILLVGGTLAILAFEWTNESTMGPLGVGGKLLDSFFASVTARTAGFNTIDYAQATPETLAITDALMFIGVGSASTGGGIKITTFLLLGFVIWAEVRGENDVTVFHRRIGGETVRQAVTVALIGVGVVALGTLALLMTTEHPLEAVLFEATSAFGTVGLSTGITSTLPAPAQIVLVILMFIGRVGTIATATALALRNRPRLYQLPKERPIVG